MTPPTPTRELLERYLPPQNGRTPADRLRAIAGKALQDDQPRFEHEIGRTLTPEERYDLHSAATMAGLESAQTYDETLDRGTGSVPLDIRFGRFAYLRMRQRLIDEQRRRYIDKRPGRIDKRHELLEPEAMELKTNPPPWDETSFGQLAAEVAWKLTALRRYTLEVVAKPMSEGQPLAMIAKDIVIPEHLMAPIAQLLIDDLETALKDPDIQEAA